MVPLEELEDAGLMLNLTPVSVKQIASLAQLREYPAGATLFGEGDHSPFVYLLLSGEVALDVDTPGCGRRLLETVGPGNLLGWSAAIGPGAMTATARTLSRCRLACLEVVRARMLCEADPRFSADFLRWIARTLEERLHATRLQLLECRQHAIPVRESVAP